MDRLSWAVIMSSASTKPTRITLSDIAPTIVSSAAAGALPAHGDQGGRPPIGTLAHPAASALGEVVVDAYGRSHADQEGDALGRRHHARGIEGDPDRLTRAQRE